MLPEPITGDSEVNGFSTAVGKGQNLLRAKALYPEKQGPLLGIP
jgi:hypothetical protein